MTKQPEESPTPYAAMISKKMGLMDFHKACHRAGAAGARNESMAERLYFPERKDTEGVEMLC